MNIDIDASQSNIELVVQGMIEQITKYIDEPLNEQILDLILAFIIQEDFGN